MTAKANTRATPASEPYNLQLKDFFVDLGQTARMLVYAIEYRDEGYIPRAANI